MLDHPNDRHNWLARLTGTWENVSECAMGPDQEPQRSTARMTCRMLGGLWLIAESRGEMPDGDEFLSIMTIGFDPKKDRFVGTFVASMMAYLWPYEGQLDASANKLPLFSTGPKFDGAGTTDYCDTIEIVSDDEWLFYGDVKGDDGQWHRLMLTTCRRVMD